MSSLFKISALALGFLACGAGASAGYSDARGKAHLRRLRPPLFDGIPPGLLDSHIADIPHISCRFMLEDDSRKPLPRKLMEMVDTRLLRTQSPDDFLNQFAGFLSRYDHRYTSNQMERYWMWTKGRDRDRVRWHFFDFIGNMAGGIFYTLGPSQVTIWHYSFDVNAVTGALNTVLDGDQRTQLATEMLVRELLFLQSSLDYSKQRKFKFIWNVPFFDNVQREALERLGFTQTAPPMTTQFARLPYVQLEKKIALSMNEYLARHDSHVERNGPEFLNRSRIGSKNLRPLDILDAKEIGPNYARGTDDYPPTSIEESGMQVAREAGGIYLRAYDGNCVGVVAGRMFGNVFELHFLTSDADSHPNSSIAIRLALFRKLRARLEQQGITNVVVRGRDLATQLFLDRHAHVRLRTLIPRVELYTPFAGDQFGYVYEIPKVPAL